MVRNGVTRSSKTSLGENVSDLQAKTENEKKYLLSKDEVEAYNVMFECTWNQFKKEHKELLETFWRHSKLDPKRPLSRLVPRAAIRGGFTEVYRLSYEAHLDQKIHYLDCNSLYPSISKDLLFPLGEYQIILEEELQKKLHIVNNKFWFDNEDCSSDICHVSILAPSNLKKPFLGYRLNDQNYYALCFQCLRNKSTIPCRHRSDEKRRFCSTYTVIEIEYALTLGYKILYVYELYHYSKKAQVMKEFVQVMYSNRLKSSTFLEEVPLGDREQLCNELNNKMQFNSSDLKLAPGNVAPNTALNKMYKSLLNNLCGRFALNSNFSKRIFVRSQLELEGFFANKEIEVIDFFPIGDSTVEIEYVKNAAASTNKEGNLFYTALINAHARIFMYSLIKTLERDNCDILYVDTDALIFTSKPNYALPVRISPALGEFKHVLGPHAAIKKFYSLGPRNYCLLFEENNQLKYVTKIKGLNISSHNLTDTIRPETYEKFIASHFENKVIHEYIPQSRARVDVQTKTFRQIMLAQKFTNELHLKRFILKNEKSHVTYPYGYNFSNV